MAELNGYIKLYRKLIMWGWYQDVVVKSLFLHCLLLASFRDFDWMDKRLKAGQFVTSYKRLAEDLGFSVQQIRTALKKLESTGEITSTSTNKFSIITVMNWENYQIDIEESNTQSNNPITNEQQTNNKQITNNQQHIKNIKNNKNYKNYKNIYSSSSKRKKKPASNPFVPPTLEEVQAYCESRGNKVDAKQFYDYFTASDWVDSKGNEVKSWKQKIITWESYRQDKPQNKVGANGVAVKSGKSELEGVF